jgi:hypothetical protein
LKNQATLDKEQIWEKTRLVLGFIRSLFLQQGHFTPEKLINIAHILQYF